MLRKYLILIITLVTILGNKVIVCHKHSSSPLLLIVSFDGFRWDYLKTHNLENFEKLKLNSSYADFIYSSFSTVTFPNHWTLVTGLYEESHGMVQNEMYDPVLKKTFTITDPAAQTIEWYGQNKAIEPIWTTNQKADEERRSAAEWVGSGVVFDNQTIVAIPYNHSASFRDLIDQFITLFTSAHEPINFGALYFDEPDHTGHLYGPNSPEMKAKLKEIDETLGYLVEQLISHHLYDKLNLIITSDHGMEDVSKERAIFLDSYVDLNLFDAYGSRACLNLFLKDTSNVNEVYNKLKKIENVDVYKHDEIPSNLHYKMNSRIGDIVIFARISYSVYLNNNTDVWKTLKGDHGYYTNESSMHAIFIGHGPGFKKGVQVKPFYNVDVYPLMCHLLGIMPGPNNGSVYRVLDMLVLKEVNDKFGFVFFGLLLIPLSILVITCGLAWYTKRHANKGKDSQVACEYVSVATSETALVGNDDETELDSNDRIRFIGDKSSRPKARAN